jgi:hypothetical protein
MSCTIHMPVKTKRTLSANSGSIHFMQYENDKASSSSAHEQELPRRPAIIDFQMDSTLVKENALRSSQVEPTCSYASSPGTAYSMYNRALVFSDQEDDLSFMVIYKHRTAAIILYNLALVHHTIGIQLGVSGTLPHMLYGCMKLHWNQSARGRRCPYYQARVY